jgi:hypothetical protein
LTRFLHANRCPPRIKSGASFRSKTLQPAAVCREDSPHHDAGDGDEWLTITLALPAASGWGPPGHAMVREGLLDGFVTPEQAKTVYTAG